MIRRFSLPLAAIFTLTAALLYSRRSVRRRRIGRLGSAAAADERLATVTKYLSSDELEGRGINTQGLGKAADYIAKQFTDLGLKTDLFAGTPFQKFNITTGAKLAEGNRLEFFGPNNNGDPEAIKLEAGKDYTPLAFGSSGKFDLPLVFVGYGITAKEEGYDDYAGVDVKDKAVIILRHAPEQEQPAQRLCRPGPFAKLGPAAQGVERLRAWGRGRDLCERQIQPAQIGRQPPQPLPGGHRRAERGPTRSSKPWPTPTTICGNSSSIASTSSASTSNRSPPSCAPPTIPWSPSTKSVSAAKAATFRCCGIRRRIMERVIKPATGTTLEGLELSIDKDLKPRSKALEDWSARGEVKDRPARDRDQKRGRRSGRLRPAPRPGDRHRCPLRPLGPWRRGDGRRRLAGHPQRGRRQRLGRGHADRSRPPPVDPRPEAAANHHLSGLHRRGAGPVGQRQLCCAIPWCRSTRPWPCSTWTWSDA